MVFYYHYRQFYCIFIPYILITIFDQCSFHNDQSDSFQLTNNPILYYIDLLTILLYLTSLQLECFIILLNIYISRIRIINTQQMLKQKSLQARLNSTKSIFLIGDEGSDKSFIFEFLQLQQQELNHQINIYVKVMANMSSIQIYDFPGDKLVRNAIQLYLKLLSQPMIIMYFMKNDGSDKDISDWIQILNKFDISSKIIFISDVTTYTQRQKILYRIGKQFQSNILDIILFVKLQPYTFRRAFENLQGKGISIEQAVCLRPTLSRKIINAIQKFISNLKKKKASNGFFSKSQQERSVV